MKFLISLAVFVIVWAGPFFGVPVPKLVNIPEIATGFLLVTWAVISFGMAAIAAGTIWRALK